MILAGGTSDHRLFLKSLRQEPWSSLGLTLAGGFFLTLNQHGVHQGRATESEPWFHHLKKRFARSSDFTKSASPLLFFFIFVCLFGCVESQLGHVGSFIAACRLSSCGAPLWHMDLSSLLRNQTHVPCIERQMLNHWTTGEVSSFSSPSGEGDLGRRGR